MRDDYLDGKNDGGSTEIGFTVQFRYEDENGNTHTEDTMFFYGKEGSMDDDLADVTKRPEAKEDK